MKVPRLLVTGGLRDDEIELRLRLRASAPVACITDAIRQLGLWLRRKRYPGLLSKAQVIGRRNHSRLAFPSTSSPDVSVIIPAYGKYPLTWACLEALASASTRCAFEVIVVDDASPDATAEIVSAIAGVRVLRNQQNLGFIGACNAAASVASAPWLCFLNNDTRVTDGWLDALLWTVDSDAEIGLVGSQLVFPDGRMQEAGATVFSDGTAFHLGRNRDPRRPEHNFARDVDYVSGASLLIDCHLFRQLGGFDDHYAPAYYEDSDLAFRARQVGRRVRYQPLSRVVHYEGMTNGRNEESGVRKYQLVNREKFVTRWHKELTAEHPPAEWRTVAAATRRQPVKYLILVNELPTAGSIDFEQVLRLARSPRHISIYPLKQSGAFDTSVELRRAGVEVLYAPYISSIGQAIVEASRRGSLTVWAWDSGLAELARLACRSAVPTARIFGRCANPPKLGWKSVASKLHGIAPDDLALLSQS